MVGSIRLPSSAVVAMVEPEIAENTVPATMAMTDSRPGTRRMMSAKASIALSAKPVWNSTSPISTKNGIGVSEKLVIDCTALRASWARPGSPPRKSIAPMTLSARNANATGRPRPIAATRPPNSRTLPSIQVIQLTDVASMRRARSPLSRRSKRNTNSTASNTKVAGSHASSHHSGNTRFLMVIAPSRQLSTVMAAP